MTTIPTTPSGLLLIISGPSGVGKTTIAHRVEEELNGTFSVSMTTRPKTVADTEGRDYCFVDRVEFDRIRDAGDLLEWAEVFGHCYGTPAQPVSRALEEGRLMILEIDVEGAGQVKQKRPNAYAIFILPPSEDVLLDRLCKRRREDEATIQRRFTKAKAEIARAKTGGVYSEFVVNEDLDAAVRATVDLIRQEMQRRRSGQRSA